MAQMERQISINAPTEKVYGYLADLTRHPEWAGDSLQVQQTSQGPVAAGATFTSTAKMMGSHTAQIALTELVPNSKIAFEAEDDSGRFRHYFVLQEEGAGTRLTKGVEMLKPSMMSRLLAPLLVGRITGADLKRIKAKLESSAG